MSYPLEQNYINGEIPEIAAENSNPQALRIIRTGRQSSGRTFRIALYSHDTMGLGHIRRNLLIAQSLADSRLRPEILLIGGSAEANAFSMPSTVQYYALPSLRKDLNGEYCSGYQDLSLNELVSLRAREIREALEAFRPDLFIVDKVPRGALCELDSALEYLRKNCNADCILGLRDILDDHEVVQREWIETENERAIREYFDAILIYGDPRIYDLSREYSLSRDIAAKVNFTGYHDQRVRLKYSKKPIPLPEHFSKRFFLCLVGGGQDGARLAETFSMAKFPTGIHGVILTGPFMSPAVQIKLQEQTTSRSDLHVFDFLPEPVWLMDQAERVVAMGGYNTISEILSFEKRALIVPRIIPRREQLIRTERLRDLEFVDMLHPNELTPDSLSDWLHCEERGHRPVRRHVDFKGLQRVENFVRELASNSNIVRRMK